MQVVPMTSALENLAAKDLAGKAIDQADKLAREMDRPVCLDLRIYHFSKPSDEHSSPKLDGKSTCLDASKFHEKSIQSLELTPVKSQH